MSRFSFASVSLLALTYFLPGWPDASGQEGTDPQPAASEKPSPDFLAEMPLPQGALARLGTHSLRHCDNLTGVAFSANGSLIATVGRDHAACLWDRATGKLRHRIADPEIDFQTLAFSPDSKKLLLAGCKPNRGDGSFLQIHDAVTGQELHRMQGHEQPINAFWFVPGKSSFWSISCDAALSWDLNTGKPLDQRTPNWPTGIIAVAQHCPVLAFASNKRDEPIVQLFDPRTGKTILNIDGELKEVADPQFPDKTQTKLVKPDQAIVALALSPDGKMLASGSPFEAIRLWETTTGQLVKTLEDHQGGIALTFSPDGKYLASGTINGLVRLWNVATGKEVRKFPGFKAWVNALAFSADGKALAMAGAEARTLYLWDTATGKDLRPGPGHRGPVQAVAFSPDGRNLISASSGRDDPGQAICVWEAGGAKLLNQCGKFDSRLTAFAFTGDAKKLALAQDHQILPCVIEVSSGKTFDSFQIPPKATQTDGRDPDLRFMALAIAPDGRWLAGGGTDGKLFVWDAATGKCRHWWKGHQGMITSLAFTPDGKRLLSTSEDRSITLWQTEPGKLAWEAVTAKPLKIAQEEDSCGGVCISPDGKLAAALSAWSEGKMYLWDLETGKELNRIPITQKRINQVVFSPNSKMLAVCDVGGKIKLYEVATGKPRLCLAGHLGEITALAFSPDGMRLATGGSDTTVLIWDATAGASQMPPPPQPLSDIHLLKLWQDLAGEDPALAYQAVWQLVHCPERAEPFLQAKLKPAPNKTPEQIKDCIRQLGHASHAKRALAMNVLVNLDKQAEPFLKAALKQPATPEVFQRLRLLLDRLEMVELSTEQIRVERALETLEWIGTKSISTDLHAKVQSK